jgi:hypothetical protein
LAQSSINERLHAHRRPTPSALFALQEACPSVAASRRTDERSVPAKSSRAKVSVGAPRMRQSAPARYGVALLGDPQSLDHSLVR